jgi:hypothetical protein
MPPIIDPARLNDLEMIQQFSDVISVDDWFKKWAEKQFFQYNEPTYLKILS